MKVSLPTSNPGFNLLIMLDDASSSKSRKGTVRNTDSFFKDDTLETRKINLTPSLLRDDTNTSNSIAITSESKEVCLHFHCNAHF